MSFFTRVSHRRPLWNLLLGGLLLLALVACGEDGAEVPSAEPDTAVATTAAVVDETAVETIPPATATAVPPTPTPTPPLAATVNGEPLYLADYEQELARYEQAHAQSGLAPDAGYRDAVLQALIERMLLAQAAAAAGIAVTPAMVESNLAELRSAAGGDDNFNAWLEANQWSEAEFREALAAEMIAGQMRDRVTADVPRAVEQVNARYLQVDDGALAQELWQRAVNGDDFAFLARQNSLDRVTAEVGGELGFFARGSLLVPEVEAAAFALQPGEVSEVIAVTGDDGRQTFYLVQLIAREPQRSLEPDMQYTLLQAAFETWLADLWQQAEIVLFLETN